MDPYEPAGRKTGHQVSLPGKPRAIRSRYGYIRGAAATAVRRSKSITSAFPAFPCVRPRVPKAGAWLPDCEDVTLLLRIYANRGGWLDVRGGPTPPTQGAPETRSRSVADSRRTSPGQPVGDAMERALLHARPAVFPLERFPRALRGQAGPPQGRSLRDVMPPALPHARLEFFPLEYFPRAPMEQAGLLPAWEWFAAWRPSPAPQTCGSPDGWPSPRHLAALRPVRHHEEAGSCLA